MFSIGNNSEENGVVQKHNRLIVFLKNKIKKFTINGDKVVFMLEKYKVISFSSEEIKNLSFFDSEMYLTCIPKSDIF